MYKTQEIILTIDFLVGIYDAGLIGNYHRGLADELRRAFYVHGCAQRPDNNRRQTCLHAHHELGEALADRFNEHTRAALVAARSVL